MDEPEILVGQGRTLYCVIRFDSYQMEGGREFSAEFVTIMGRRAWEHREAAEVEAARLNTEADARGSRGIYFVRALTSPGRHAD
jgi:hypothetical protein